jgi:acyl-CoA synthetase (AMP-forming)/AMP-acid ligase II
LTDLYETIRLHGFGDVAREHRRSRPHLLAVVDGAVRLDFTAFDRRTTQLANALADRGVARGGRVLWLGQNSFRILETLIACAKLGAVFCPANWRSSADEVTTLLRDFDPAVVIWQDAEVGETLRKAREASGGDRLWLQHDAEGQGSYEGLLAAGSETDPDTRINAELPLLAVFTAAFEGKPNAALLSHSTLMYQNLIVGRGQAIDEDSVHLNSGPLFHLGTLMGALATFHLGGANVFAARVDAVGLLELIQAEKATHAFIPAPTIEQIREVNKEGLYDVSSLWSSPAAPEWKYPMCMPADAPMLRKLGGYGQSEVMGLISFAYLGGTAAGRVSPMAQVTLLDDEGREVGPGETGEFAVRGPLVMNRYLGADRENQRRGRFGWHLTNDLGKRAEDGSLIFVGPKTAIIKSADENIYPADVEGCIRQHPAVADVCVIGVPDPTWKQNVKAVIVLKPGQSASEADIIEHCRAKIASYKKPKLVTFVDALPKFAGTPFTDRKAVDAAHGGGGYPSFG